MADLNSTIVRGNLRVTEEIIGPLNVINLSAGANGQFLSISNNVPTWVNNPNTDTKYSAGSGLNLSGTTFSIDTSKVVTISDDQTITGNKNFKSNVSIEKTDPYVYFTNELGGSDTFGIHVYGTSSGNNTFGIYDVKNQKHMLTIDQLTGIMTVNGNHVIHSGNLSDYITIGLTKSLEAYNGTSQSITHTANQEVVFDGFSNDPAELPVSTKNISIIRTSDTNTNVYIQMYSARGGIIDDRVTIYYHIVTYNS